MECPDRPPARRRTTARREALLALLRDGVTRVDELAETLRVSPSTVRRDLSRLTEERRVARTYGGAVVPDAFRVRPVGESARLRTRAEADIAAAAQVLAPPAGAVFVDAGTVCVALARRLAGDSAVPGGAPEDGSGPSPRQVATRGLETAAALAEAPALEVILLGGRLRSLSRGLVGPLADLALDRMSFAIAFLGADAVDPRRGVGEPTVEETVVKERVAARAERVVVLADSTKLQGTATPAWACLTGGWTLVTDADAPRDLERRCAAEGVTLIRAPRRDVV